MREHDAKGRLIAADVAGLSDFWQWFAGSHAVDQHGRPLLLLHGTPEGAIEEFFGRESGIYFTDRPDVASGYTYRRSMWLSPSDGAAIYPAYLSLKNPLVIDARGTRNDNIPVPGLPWKPKVFGRLPQGAVSIRDLMRMALERGHDGLIVRNVVDTASMNWRDKSNVYAVAESAQIRSAIAGGTVFAARPADVVRANQAQQECADEHDTPRG